MKSRNCKSLLILIALALVCIDARAANYQVTHVMSQPAGTNGLSVGEMNNAGELVLNTFTNNPSNPFVSNVKPYLYLPAAAYGLGAGLIDLSLQPGYLNHSANSINNLGQIAGRDFLSNGFIMSALYLPTPAFSRPAGWGRVDPSQTLQDGKINDSGLIALHNHGMELAAVWAPSAISGYSGGINNKSDPARPSDWGFGVDINESGEMVGRAFDPNVSGPAQTFAYLPSATHGRSAGWHVAPLINGAGVTEPVAINNFGEIVGTGQFNTPTFYQKGYIWRLGTNSHGAGGLFDLGGGPGDSVSPADVNDNGIVVGTRNIAGSIRAFIWSSAIGLVDLNTKIDPSSGWLLQTATTINDNGQIAGIGLLDGVRSPYILSVPEPSVGALLLFSTVMVMRRLMRRHDAA